MSKISVLGFAFGFVLTGLAGAQDRVQPGVLYYEGDDIHAPIVGVETKIPLGWSGMIPHDSEIFFLIPNGGEDVQLFVRAYQSTIEKVREGWMNQGLELQPGLTIRSDGNIGERAGWITSNVIVEGDMARKRIYQAYLEARCGEFGYCMTLFLVSPKTDYARFKKDVHQFADNIEFVEPSLEDVFADFESRLALLFAGLDGDAGGADPDFDGPGVELPAEGRVDGGALLSAGGEDPIESRRVGGGRCRGDNQRKCNEKSKQLFPSFTFSRQIKCQLFDKSAKIRNEPVAGARGSG